MLCNRVGLVSCLYRSAKKIAKVCCDMLQSFLCCTRETEDASRNNHQSEILTASVFVLLVKILCILFWFIVFLYYVSLCFYLRVNKDEYTVLSPRVSCIREDRSARLSVSCRSQRLLQCHSCPVFDIVLPCSLGPALSFCFYSVGALLSMQ